MANSIFTSSCCGHSHHWLLLLALGILTSICSIWFFAQPEAAYLMLSMIFGLSLFLGGFVLFELVNKMEKSIGLVGLVVSASFSVVAGAFLIFHLGLTESVLPYVFASILFVQATFYLFSSMMYKEHRMRLIFLLNGILLLIFSFIFAFYPFSSVVALVFTSAVMMAYWGTSMIFISLYFRPQSC